MVSALFTLVSQTANASTITVVAGNSIGTGVTCDSTIRSGTSVVFNKGSAVAIGHNGYAYVADENHNVVCKVELSTGNTSLFAGNGATAGATNLGDGGPATGANLFQPSGVAVTSDGTVFIADSSHHLVRKVNPAGVITTYAGQYYTSTHNPNDPTDVGDGAAATSARLGSLGNLSYDDATKELYIADSGQFRIRKINVNGVISTVAGNGYQGNTTGVATSSSLSYANGAVYADGKVYISDTGNRLIKVVNSSGIMSTFATLASSPYAVDADNAGNIFVGGGSSGAVYRIDSNGTVTNPANVFGGAPGLALDGFGNVYIGANYYGLLYKISGVYSSSSASVSSVTSAVTNATHFYDVDVTVGLSSVSCPASVAVSVGAASTTKSICISGGTAPSSIKVGVSVLPLEPNNVYISNAVVIDANGLGTQGTGSYITPFAPVWVAAGDSYSSGHNQFLDEPCNYAGYVYAQLAYSLNGDYSGTCIDRTTAPALDPNDASFSWPSRAVDQFNTERSVPVRWQMTAYVYAMSGAKSADFPSTASTGCPGCGQQSEMENILSAFAGSWNVVSADGGADDINFADALTNYYVQFSVDSVDLNAKPWLETTRGQCPDTDTIKANLTTFLATSPTALSGLFTAASIQDPAVRKVVITYPHIMNSTSTCADHDSTTAPHEGANEVIDYLDTGYITPLSSSGVIVVDLRSSGTLSTSPIDDLQQTRYFGYPHPSAQGQVDIAGLVLAAVS